SVPYGRHSIRLALAPGHAHGRVARGAAQLRRAQSRRHAPANDVPGAHFKPQSRVFQMSAEPVLIGAPSDAALTDQLLEPMWAPKRRSWLFAFAFTAAGSLMFFALILYTFWVGIGVWGNNIPVAWAFGITNFVWWIGIGHAGTFISAILLLFEQKWR